MTFKQIISDNLMNGFSGADITVAEIVTTLGITFLIAMYLFFVYRLITKNAFYSKEYNIAMVAMAIVTAGIILAMQSSLVISLGMVGALSIVRFRTAIKEPIDLLFLFWSIGTGIICGAGLYKVAIVLAVCVTIAIAILKYIPETKTGHMMFVGYHEDISTEDISGAVSRFGKILTIRSVNVTATGTNAVFEVRVSDAAGMVNAVKSLSGVDTVSLVAHDGEFRG
ncbi:MAG: DUF4956 domain-containing protein [Lachnospiraceae bacterium]|nr:DUF4956 domain-containing protein [Lachnospiraceae bacterium]